MKSNVYFIIKKPKFSRILNAISNNIKMKIV
jgi:hypothetical protein